MQGDARTVEEYLGELPDDRRTAISAVRAVVLANLPDGMVESMNWGMISYEVPLEFCPDTYNGQPLSYAAIASQKQHMSVYLMGIYGSETLRERFEADYRATGKRMDIGKACVRFRKLDDLPLDLVGDAIAAVSMGTYISMYQRSRSLRASKKAHG
jgi:hypothetical protein